MTRPRASTLADPDRRYWRRRVNRQVRKARRWRTTLHWSAILLVNLAILSVLALSGARAWRHLKTSPELALRHVHVENARRSSPDAIRERLADLRGQNLLDLDLDEVTARVLEEPWVRTCSVKRVLPSALRVTVSEREPRARARIGRTVWVVDSTGHAVCPFGPGLPEGLPLLTGLDRMRDPERREALRRAVRHLERLRGVVAEFAATLTVLDLSKPDRITVSTKGSGPRILLDPDRAERNVNDYLALRGEIDDRIGPMEYIDLRWRDRIAIMPEGELSITENR